MKLLCCIIWIVVASGRLCAQQDQDDLWISAQDAYLSDDLTTAAMKFEQFLNRSPRSAAAMYNLANCYLQQGDVGRAVLYYERALKLRPNDPDIRHNLSIAKSRRTSSVVEIREFFAKRWLRKISEIMTPSGWAIISIISFWCCAGGVALKLRSGRWRIPRWITGAFLLCFLLSLLMSMQRNFEMQRNDRAVVMRDETILTLAPDPKSKRIAKVDAGEKVLILDSLDTYFKIRLANFEQGWIAVNAIERI